MSSQVAQTECLPAVASHADLVALLTNEVLTDFFQMRDAIIGKTIILGDEVLSKWVSTKAELKEANKLDSCFFNPLRTIPICETTHSAILGDLLNPQGSHGQDKLFLLSFLSFLKVPNPTEGEWIITVERGRIDILLRRLKPISVVIIENKSNDAGDQENQLYQYWYQAICQPYHAAPDYDYLTKLAFKIVYLTSNSSKVPNKNSLERPEWAAKMNLPKRIPIEPRTITFQELMQIWLAGSGSKLNATKNPRLTTFLRFYSELWLPI